MKIDDLKIGAKALAPMALSLALLITLAAFRIGVPSHGAPDRPSAVNLTMTAPY